MVQIGYFYPMHRLNPLGLLIGLLFLCPCVTAQTTCQFQLLLRDTVTGDGWNGAVLTIFSGGQDQSYALTREDGSFRREFFEVTDGQDIRLAFQRGAFPEEVSFEILDNDEQPVVSFTAPADDENLLTFTPACVACAPPPAVGVTFTRRRTESVDLAFRAAAEPDARYLIEYRTLDSLGMAVDTTELTVTGTSTRVRNLSGNTAYEFYLRTLCPTAGDTSARRGPFTLRTPRALDVGVTDLLNPTDRCDPGNAEVDIELTNFGGDLVSLFPVNFSVNGGPPVAVPPFSGLFTGIASPDSVETYRFEEARADLSVPGLYRIEAWTELPGDEDPSNDTLRATVRSILRVATFPYQEFFEVASDVPGGLPIPADGNWYAERAGRGPSSWEFGELRGEEAVRAGGGRQLVWATNLDGDYNNQEVSYLNSPCFDLRGAEDDPYLTFSLDVDTEAEFDNFYVEASTDDGETYFRLRTNPISYGWYNDLADQVWTGRGDLPGAGLTRVATLMEGTAGSLTRLRFVFESDEGTTAGGIILDNISIRGRAEVDLAITEATVDVLQDCDQGTLRELDVRLANPGLTTIDSVRLTFVLEGDIVAGDTLLGGLGLTPTEDEVVTVFLPEVFSEAGPTTFFSVEAGVVGLEEAAEALLDNRTEVFQPGFRTLPFAVNFDDGNLPAGWAPEDDLLLRPAGTDGTLALTDNLAPGDTSLSFTTAEYGILTEGDSLYFDLVFTDVAGDTLLPFTRGSLTVTGRSFCGEARELLAITDTVRAGRYAVAVHEVGPSGRFTVRLTSSGGDYLAAFDNVGIFMQCPAGLELEADIVVPESMIERRVGFVTILPGRGVPPFTYDWSSGDTTASVDELPFGDYRVAVTDARGCMDTIDFAVDFSVAVEESPLEELRLSPNPTDGQVTLTGRMRGAGPLGLGIMDLSGRLLTYREVRVDGNFRHQLQLADLPAGLYFLRLSTPEGSRCLRIVRR